VEAFTQLRIGHFRRLGGTAIAKSKDAGVPGEIVSGGHGERLLIKLPVLVGNVTASLRNIIQNQPFFQDAPITYISTTTDDIYFKLHSICQSPPSSSGSSLPSSSWVEQKRSPVAVYMLVLSVKKSD
jgi:hypothetical protein